MVIVLSSGTKMAGHHESDVVVMLFVFSIELYPSGSMGRWIVASPLHSMPGPSVALMVTLRSVIVAPSAIETLCPPDSSPVSVRPFVTVRSSLMVARSMVFVNAVPVQ